MKTVLLRTDRLLTNIGLCLIASLALILSLNSQPAMAYPYFAQEAYQNPREATGKIVCANCHLAQKGIELELPQAVLPDTVFEAVVKLPYDHSLQQVTADGSKSGLNVGAVLVLPEGFKIAPEERLSEELKEKLKDTYYQPYSDTQENIVLVGPVDGEEYPEIIFPVLSPDPAKDKNVHFLKYAVHAGGNRGRGQVYPTGEKSNNNEYTSSVSGLVTQISPIAPDEEEGTYGGYEISVQTTDGSIAVEKVPAGATLVVEPGSEVKVGSALTTNPNVGGFGQHDGEIVLQDPRRIQWLLAFFASVIVTQILLVLKKKQVEKVQAAEMNF
ncbi:apocytochrome f [Pseudanabaena sp. FACHB-1277]|jgi:apocytochrome f|uniref:Cytochrome f n=1 Tax=Pseudanabaena cinerea FACHB-1277 TaxID=2949581 RepID=A0A926URR8_9CYAN|nr:apocytochrome f [Pseudanabaena cinerea]MBD2149518.1 apocytochrome f [Pseudanabaena cinerea FACHB-1277]